MEMRGQNLRGWNLAVVLVVVFAPAVLVVLEWALRAVHCAGKSASVCDPWEFYAATMTAAAFTLTLPGLLYPKAWEPSSLLPYPGGPRSRAIIDAWKRENRQVAVANQRNHRYWKIDAFLSWVSGVWAVITGIRWIVVLVVQLGGTTLGPVFEPLFGASTAELQASILYGVAACLALVKLGVM